VGSRRAGQLGKRLSIRHKIALELKQNCLAYTSNPEVRADIVQADFSAFVSRSNACDAVIDDSDQYRLITISNPHLHVVGCLVVKPTAQNLVHVLVIGFAKLRDRAAQDRT
jgi:hypothetical protein